MDRVGKFFAYISCTIVTLQFPEVFYTRRLELYSSSTLYGSKEETSNITNFIQEAQNGYTQTKTDSPHKRFDFDKKIETNIISVLFAVFICFFVVFSI